MTDNLPNKSSSSTKIKPQPPSNNPLPTQSGNKKDEIPVFEDEIKATKEEVQSLLERILEKISSRFVKKYLPPMENILEDTQFFIPVEFYECKNKRPIPEHKVIIIFKVGRNLDKKHIFFQIENESVSYPLFSSINLSYFESIIDRVLLDKYKTSQALHLESNFESTRILNLNGETKKLYTILDKENIFLNNKSEYYRYEGVDLNFKIRTDDEILKLIKILWKTLVANDLKPMSVIIDELKKEKEKEKNNELNNATTGKKKKELKKEEEELFEEKIKKLKEERKQECENLTMSYSQFKLFFEYLKCEMNEENIAKLWKYTNKKKTETIQFQEFVVFAVYLIHSLGAFYIAKYKHEHNNCFENKINNCVNIMNYHFKEYDTDNNQEISFENLKKSLLKENELFTRKDIEIILRQINPENNFQYWKFDKILHILYYNHFNYQKLMEEDKIYNYLIQIFRKQDPHHVGKLHYKKMKLAFLTEDKIKFDKTEILILLAQFDIYKCPEIDYYQASLLLRNIVEYLLGSDIGMQKLNIKDNNNVYEDFEDEYDEYCQKVKEIFTKYDEDFDHILNKNEFIKFIKWLIHYIDEETIEELFNIMDQDKDGVLNYQEFKNGFKKLMEITRVRNVIKEIKTIKNEIKPENEGNNNINENEDKNKDINDNNDNAANNENNNDENKS